MTYQDKRSSQGAPPEVLKQHDGSMGRDPRGLECFRHFSSSKRNGCARNRCNGEGAGLNGGSERPFGRGGGRAPFGRGGGGLIKRGQQSAGYSGAGSKMPEKKTGVVTRDLELCGKRVRELLKGRHHGLFIARLEKMYEKKFSENLPDDWTLDLKSAGHIDIVKEEGGLLLVKHVEGLIVDPNGIDTHYHGVSVTSDEMTRLQERILQLLQGRADGLLVFQLEKMYFKQWSEKLEGDWVSKLEQMRGIVVDREGEQVVLRGELRDKNSNTENCNSLAMLDSGVAELLIGNNGGGREMVG